MQKILGAALAAMLMAGAANAALIVVTATGKVATGAVDTNNVFGFGAGASLADMDYTLTFNFDTTGAARYTSASYDQYNGAAAAPSAVLTLAGAANSSSFAATGEVLLRNNYSSTGQQVYNYLYNSNTNNRAYLNLLSSVGGVYNSLMVDTGMDYTLAGNESQSSYYLIDGNQINLNTTRVTSSVAAAVPEPATWAMMIVGFGAVGYSLRRQRKVEVSFG